MTKEVRERSDGTGDASRQVKVRLLRFSSVTDMQRKIRGNEGYMDFTATRMPLFIAHTRATVMFS